MSGHTRKGGPPFRKITAALYQRCGETEEHVDHVRRPRTRSGLGRSYEIVPRKDPDVRREEGRRASAPDVSVRTIRESRRLHMASGMSEGSNNLLYEDNAPHHRHESASRASGK